MLNESHNADVRIYIVAYQGSRVSERPWQPFSLLGGLFSKFWILIMLNTSIRQLKTAKIKYKTYTWDVPGMPQHIWIAACRIPRERSISKYLVLWISKKCVKLWKVWLFVHFPTINGPTFSTFWKRTWCCCCDRMQCLSGLEYCSIPSDIWWENTRSDSTSRDMADWRSSSGLGRLYNIKQNVKPEYSFYKEKWWVAIFE